MDHLEYSTISSRVKYRGCKYLMSQRPFRKQDEDMCKPAQFTCIRSCRLIF